MHPSPNAAAPCARAGRPARVVVLLALALAVVAGLLSPSPASAKGATDDFTIYAHRGLRDAGHTENTMRAFRHAHRHGARAIETDVMLTRDRRFLLMHDPTLNRSTTCTGRVVHHTLPWIRANCHGRQARETLPTVGQLLTLARHKRLRLILELKRSTPWAADDVRRLHAAIARHRMVSRVVIHSFSARHLRMVERVAPALHTQYITDNLAEVRAGRRHFDGVNVWARLLTKALVRRLHAGGLLVLGRDSESPRDWARIRRTGADGLVTDSTVRATRWLRDRRRY